MKGNELPHAAPEAVGMSGERLNNIRDVVQGFIDEGRLQGAVVSVARRGKVVYFEAQGVANGAPLQNDAMFNMASSTKPILGVAAMMMIEEGKFKPSDPVEKYIPEFKDIKVVALNKKGWSLVDVHRPVTIHDLLTHTSGISALPQAKGTKKNSKKNNEKNNKKNNKKNSKKNSKKQRDANQTLATWIPQVSELVALRWDMVDLKRGLLHVSRLKNGIDSVHPLRGPELRALRKLKREYPDTEYIFITERGGPMTDSNVRKMVKRAGENAKIGFLVHPHMLRHSAEYKLANAGHDTRAIQQYMGHKNIQHTVRYTELTPERFKDFWKD